ncbi:hypothetical protein ACIQI7_14225 [Kitasatospora sp. NPDC092039]|uniref:hypothetical protein n=1 Tax=Kitasatospora sp. NPDC092039 TaxID=3364086 RepID=UPI003828E5F9
MATTNAPRFNPAALTRIEALILLVATLDVSEAEARRQTGRTRAAPHAWFRVSDVYGSRQPLRQELIDLAEGLPPDLKAAVRDREKKLYRICEQCEEPKVPPPGRPGRRPQRFCSNACRQKTHRRRTRDTTTS